MLLGKLHSLQFGTPFQEAKFLATRLEPCGFGAAVPNYLCKCFAYSYLYNRTLLLDDSRLIYDFCYEPVSSHHFSDISEQYGRQRVEFNFLPQQEKVVYFFLRSSDPFPFMKDLVFRRFNFVHPAAPLVCGLAYFKGLVLDGFLKLKPEYQARIEEVRKKIGFKGPIIGVHIRHGDVKTDDALKQHRYLPLQVYLEVVKRVADKTGIKTVFVTSDSEEVIRQLPANSGIDFIYDDKEQRHDASVAAMLRESPELRKQETLTAVKNIHLLADCDYIIGESISSWFTVARSISYYRKKKPNGIALKKTGGTCRLNYFMTGSDAAEFRRVVSKEVTIG